jgi:hypothetical protein
LGLGQFTTVFVKVPGTFNLRAEHVRVATGVEVSGGPGRLIYLAVALAAGLFVWRRPQSAVRLFWIAALVLGCRCLFEAVMTPYYLAPPLILAVAVASRCSRARFWSASSVAIATSLFAYLRFSPWVWWSPVVVGSAVVLALAYPGAERIGEVSDAASVDAAILDEAEVRRAAGAVPTEPVSTA